jgi:type II secretory pathway component PulF
MKIKPNNDNRLSREKLCNPWEPNQIMKTMRENLEKNKSANKSFRFIDLNNGYCALIEMNEEAGKNV